MKLKLSDKQTAVALFIKKLISELPHAFDYPYWNMANTSYSQEIAISAISSLKLNGQSAILFLNKAGFTKTNNGLLHLFYNGDVTEGMGTFSGVTKKGKAYIAKYH